MGALDPIAKLRTGEVCSNSHATHARFAVPRLTLIASAALFALLPVAAPGDQASDTKPYTLVGTWSCESIAHSTGLMTFTANVDGSIHMTNHFRTQTGVVGSFDETYRFDPTTAQWKWNSSFANDPGFSEDGTATVWSPDSDRWVFDGTVREEHLPEPNSIKKPRFAKEDQRMVYTLLDKDVLRREFEVRRDGYWVTTSASTCKRAPEAT